MDEKKSVFSWATAMDNADDVLWTCPHCGEINAELPETTMAECSGCGASHDMPGGA